VKALGAVRTAFGLVAIGLAFMLATRHALAGLPLNKGVVRRVETREKVVALTYDDGPHPIFTPEILKALDKYGVKATFFMIGSLMERHPAIVKDVVARGHAIGNHTYTHPHNIEADTPAEVMRELDRCEQVIERMTGKRTQIFRPPLGLVDRAVLRIAEEAGYRTILWTVCADHHDAPTPELMAQRVLKEIRPGAIILAHDGRLGIRWKDVAATPVIIQFLLERGYRFVTVPELLTRSTQVKALSSSRAVPLAEDPADGGKASHRSATATWEVRRHESK
jgi:peptidoglycan/xylan/chitin deacetylase (PgdA/CDA1 family)